MKKNKQIIHRVKDCLKTIVNMADLISRLKSDEKNFIKSDSSGDIRLVHFNNKKLSNFTISFTNSYGKCYTINISYKRK